LSLALFDLDHTLLEGDSDYLWGKFLASRGILDSNSYERKNRRFYRAYLQGTLDIHEFLCFQLKSLAEHDPETLYRWRSQFFKEAIQPIVLPAALNLLGQHRARGDTLLIITATNRFITAPIAEFLGVDELLATEPEMIEGRYTGRATGIPCFREGKVTRLEQWLYEHHMTLAQSWFYSDSHNDIPLLERVTYPVAVDPDEALAKYATRRNWRIISLRGESEEEAG
jgi:HAD-superfamily subfamily IB hydrolase, TIGR01490